MESPDERYKLAERVVGSGALGFELVDEVSAYRQKFDEVRNGQEAAALSFLMPFMDAC